MSHVGGKKPKQLGKNQQVLADRLLCPFKLFYINQLNLYCSLIPQIFSPLVYIMHGVAISFFQCFVLFSFLILCVCGGGYVGRNTCMSAGAGGMLGVLTLFSP